MPLCASGTRIVEIFLVAALVVISGVVGLIKLRDLSYAFIKSSLYFTLSTHPTLIMDAVLSLL